MTKACLPARWKSPTGSVLIAALPVVALVLCAASACGDGKPEVDDGDEGDGGAAPNAEDCTTDEDCEAGKACHLTDSAGYCAPRCATENDCPAPIACTTGEEQPNARSCDKVFEGDAQGACDLYVGDFGPNTCAGATMACSEEASDGSSCTCSVGIDPGSDSSCPTAAMPGATCCASPEWPGGGTCQCSLVECASVGGGCMCADRQILDAFDVPAENTTASCPTPPPGGVCCVTETGMCWCEDQPSLCDAIGRALVPTCNAAAVPADCSGEDGPVASCNP